MAASAPSPVAAGGPTALTLEVIQRTAVGWARESTAVFTPRPVARSPDDADAGAPGGLRLFPADTTVTTGPTAPKPLLDLPLEFILAATVLPRDADIDARLPAPSCCFCRGGATKEASLAESVAELDITYLDHAAGDGDRDQGIRTLRLAALPPDTAEDAAAFVAAIDRAVYPNGPLRILPIISPVSGQGKGEKLWTQLAVPVLAASRHEVLPPLMTTHKGHAEEAMANGGAESARAGVVVAVGGDGMAHEVINGLLTRRLANSKRADAAVAGSAGTQAPPEPVVGLFPTGSGCALHKTLGLLEGASLRLAAAALVHARALRIDLREVTMLPPSDGAWPEVTTDDAQSGAAAPATTPPAASPVVAGKDGDAPTDHEPLVQSGGSDGAASRPPSYGTDGPAPATGAAAAASGPLARCDTKDALVTAATSRWAFLSVNVCFGAEVDIDSEVHRWMGNARFTYYAVKKLAGGAPMYPCKVRFHPVSAVASPTVTKAPPAGAQFDSLQEVRQHVDKYSPSTLDDQWREAEQEGMASAAEASRTTGSAAASPTAALDDVGAPQASTAQATVVPAATAPPPRPWRETPGDSLCFCILCNTPWIARDMQCAPYSHPADGTMDLVYTEGTPTDPVGRTDLVGALLGMEDGTHLDGGGDKFRYVKCDAVVLRPRACHVVVDGELMPFGDVVVRRAAERIPVIFLTPPTPLAK